MTDQFDEKYVRLTPQERLVEAHKSATFASILHVDGKQETIINTPGHEGRNYSVRVKAMGLNDQGLPQYGVNCQRNLGMGQFEDCKSRLRPGVVCYHGLAAIIKRAENAGTHIRVRNTLNNAKKQKGVVIEVVPLGNERQDEPHKYSVYAVISDGS